MRKLFVILGLAASLTLVGFLLMDSTKSNYEVSFSTQSECESSTGKGCIFSSCDYKCEDSKYGYFKGYIPKE